jgi:hypothetical protein
MRRGALQRSKFQTLNIPLWVKSGYCANPDHVRFTPSSDRDNDRPSGRCVPLATKVQRSKRAQSTDLQSSSLICPIAFSLEPRADPVDSGFSTLFVEIATRGAADANRGDCLGKTHWVRLHLRLARLHENLYGLLLPSCGTTLRT